MPRKRGFLKEGHIVYFMQCDESNQTTPPPPTKKKKHQQQAIVEKGCEPNMSDSFPLQNHKQIKDRIAAKKNFNIEKLKFKIEPVPILFKIMGKIHKTLWVQEAFTLPFALAPFSS